MSRQRIALLVVVGVALLAGLIAKLAAADASSLDKAIAHLDDQDRFATSTRAGQTVADIAAALRVEGTACRADKQDRRNCDALLSAAAFSTVSAVNLLDCSAADIDDARRALGDYLRELRDYIDDGARGGAPTLPKVISC